MVDYNDTKKISCLKKKHKDIYDQAYTLFFFWGGVVFEYWHKMNFLDSF